MSYSADFLAKLEDILGKNNITENENLSRHTTLKIGGPARFFIKADTVKKLMELIKLLKENSVRFYIIGNGSNILAADDGFDGVIIKLTGDFEKITVNKCEITAGSGVLLSLLSKTALDNSLKGLEFASGIPGTTGGGLVMNAGAYGGEMKQVVKTVTALVSDGEDYIIKTFDNIDMNFSYRHSIAKEKEVIFLDAVFKLEEGIYDEIKASMDDMNKSRREKQPLEYPSAGSTFKRPEGYFAGKLISDAGLKGYSVGDACVSEKHAGFCINKGNASAKDFKRLMDDVSDKVYSLYQVRLEPEVIVLE